MCFEVFELFRNIFKTSFNVEEACRRQNLTESMVEKFREALKSSEIVPKVMITSQLLLFLNAAKGDVNLAVQKIEKFYELKHEYPEFFKDRDVNLKEVRKCLDNLIFVNLPVTPDNHLTFCHRLRTYDPKDYHFDNTVKTAIMQIEVGTFYNGPRDGIVYIDDLSGMKFSHMFRPKISSVRKSLKFLQEASPLDIKAVHVFNTVPFIRKVYAIAKPFLRSEILNKIHFHPPDVDYEDFQKNFGIPKSHLPSDYGGDLLSLEEMHLQQQEELFKMRDYFLMEEAQMHFKYDHLLDEIERAQLDGTLPK